MSAIPSWARVGAKVVCIGEEQLWPDGPSVGEVCTIREVEILRGFAALRFEEYVSQPVYRRVFGRVVEYAFEAKYFRPLITLETDIATHFRQHLDVREPEGV